MKKNKIYFIVYSFLVLLFYPADIQAQQILKRSVTGRITAPDGETLPGVNVVLKEINKGTITNIEGEFEILNVPMGEHTLAVSCIGFQTLEQPLNIQSKPAESIILTLTEETYQINDITVEGKSATRRIVEQAYQVASVSTKDLFNSTADAKAVMNRISGIRIQEEGGLGSDFSFTLNGFSGDQVKFFMDGIPMDNFGTVNLGDLPVNMIERIDVYKGVVPVWLGTDALGGAVNIVTKRNEKYFDASYSFGSFGTHRMSVNGAYTSKKTGFTFRGNLFYNYSDNNYKVLARIVELNTVVDTTWVRRFHDRYRSGSIKLETGYVNTTFADNLLLGVMLSANDKQVQNGATMNTVYGGIMRNSTSIVPNLKYNKKNLWTDGLDLSLFTALNLSESQIKDTLSGVRYNWLGEKTVLATNDGNVSTDGEFYRTLTTHDEQEFNYQLNLSYALNNQSSLALNYAFNIFHRKAFDAEHPDNLDNRFPKSLRKQVLGLAWKYDLNKRWSTTIFGKMYRSKAKTSKEYDFALKTHRIEEVMNAQINFGYGLASTWFIFPELQLKLSYENTSRMPVPEEIFGDGLFVDVNPDLDPEQSHNFNLGFQYQLKFKTVHQLALSSSLIYRDAKDLIYTVVTVSSPKTHYDNLSQTRVVGFESSFLYQWNKIVIIGANLTYQDITDRAKLIYNESYTGTGWQPNFHYGFRLPNKPYLFANTNAGLNFDDFIVSGSSLRFNYYLNFVERYFLTWVELGSGNSKYVIPRQVSQDVELSYSWSKGKYNVSAECRNLFDAKLYDKYYLQKPGRAFSIKLRYSI